MRSDARKRTDLESRIRAEADVASRAGESLSLEQIADDLTASDPLAPIVALAESADRQFGSAQVITRDALWAAIAVARGEQS